MTTRKYGLFLFACVCMVHLVTYTNGEVTPPWITLLGCVDVETRSQTIPLPNNSVTTCLKECTTSTFVGIQKNACICSKAFKDIADVQSVLLRPKSKCTGQDNGFMYLYTKVSPLPKTINQDADYGYVYVNISSSSSYEYHASKDSNETHNFICYEDSKQCKYRKYLLDITNAEYAWKQCNLVSFFDFVSCLNSTEFKNGQFWIGMYRDNPDIISTLSTLSTRASTSTSTSTSSKTPQLTTETPTPLTIATTDTPSATSLKVETITPTTSSFRTGNITSTGNPNRTVTIGAAGNPDTTRTAEYSDRTWMKIGAAFIAISVALVIGIIAVLVAFLRKKEKTQISPNDQENIIRPGSGSTPSEKDETNSDSPPQNGRPIPTIDRDTQTPGLNEQKDIAKKRKNTEKHKKNRRKDNERIYENGAEQEDVNLNDGNIDNHEIIDAPAATPVLEEQTNLQNERSKKKHSKKHRKKKEKERKKKEKKKHKKRDDEQKQDLGKDEQDDAAVHAI